MRSAALASADAFGDRTNTNQQATNSAHAQMQPAPCRIIRAGSAARCGYFHCGSHISVTQLSAQSFRSH